MAFVGLKTRQDAEWMVEKWNAVWVDGAKGKGGGQIGVEWAKTVKESQVGSSTPSFDLSLTVGEQERPAKRRKVSPNRTEVPAKADARLDEFMSVMKPRAQRSLVQDLLDESGNKQPQTAPPLPKPSVAPAQPVRKPAPEPADDAEVKPRDEAIDDDGVDDMEYMRRRMRRTLTEVEAPKDWEQDDEEPVAVAEEETAVEPEPDPEPEAPREEHVPDEASVLASGRLFVRNLPYTASSQDLEPLFKPFGPISQVGPLPPRPSPSLSPWKKGRGDENQKSKIDRDS